jgi:hypothetical protein
VITFTIPGDVTETGRRVAFVLEETNIFSRGGSFMQLASRLRLPWCCPVVLINTPAEGRATLAGRSRSLAPST